MLEAQDIAGILGELARDPDVSPSIREMFLEGHADRLKQLAESYKPGSLRIVDLGEYILVYHPSRVEGHWSRLLEVLSGYTDKLKALAQSKASISSETAINGIEPIIRQASRVDLDQPSASIIGEDWGLGKMFVHQLPPTHEALIHWCRDSLDSEVIRSLMGFDYHYWEYPGDTGSVRVQGDIVVDILAAPLVGSCRVYSKLVANEIKSILERNTAQLVKGLLEYHTRSILSNTPAGVISSINEAVSDALRRAFYSTLEDLGVYMSGREMFDIALNEEQYESSKVIKSYTAGLRILDPNEYRIFFIVWSDYRNFQRFLNRGYGEPNTRQWVIPSRNYDLEPVVIGSHWKLAGGKLRLDEIVVSLEKLGLMLRIDVSGLVKIIKMLFTSISVERVEDLVSHILCGEPLPQNSLVTHFGSPYSSLLYKLVYNMARRYARGSRVSRLSVERHKVSFTGSAYLLTETLYPASIYIRELTDAVEVLGYIAENGSSAECTRERVRTLSRLFGQKRGEVMLVASGSMKFTHPEHDTVVFRIGDSIVARITTLNTWPGQR
ncbi:MAG: hypothetical protein F7C38_02935 [Desulfurococcales archaeon]|nr:hypothetical protein [Desulfurococcales archaeon]